MSAKKDDGTSQVLIKRFVERRLPVLLEMKKNVDAGNTLTEGELQLLSRVIEQERSFGGIAEKYPEYKPMIAKVIDLYNEITAQALKNEQNS